MSMAKWNYETCKEESKKYKSRSEFQKGSIGAYVCSKKNDWLYEFFGEPKIKANGYWNYQHVKEAAEQCKTISEFEQKFYRAYAVSKINGWMDDFIWFKKSHLDIYGEIDCVYAYEFPEFNKVYVGRTIHMEIRDKEHLYSNDVLAKFIKEKNIQLPKPIILEDKLKILDGAEKEKIYMKKYKDDGWDLLNIANGGAIGIIGYSSRTYEECKEEASKYCDRKEFREKSSAIFHYCCHKKWISDFFPPKYKPDNYWCYETCKEAAGKYKTIVEFSKKEKVAHQVAVKNKWIDDFFERQKKPKGYWEDYENCKKASEECCSLTEFIKKFSRAYCVSNKMGWVDDFFKKNKKPNGYWNNYENCKNVATECKNISEFGEKYPVAYRVSVKNGWITDFFQYAKKGNGYWNDYEKCKEVALKCKTRNEFRIKYPTACSYSFKNGWIDDFFEPNKKKKFGYWNVYENCKEVAKQCDGRTDFLNKFKGAYESALRNGWLKDFFGDGRKKRSDAKR